MKFSDTETAKIYNLSINDIDFEIVKPGNLTKVPTVLIIPHEDEFPVEPFEVETLQDAEQLVAELKSNS